MVGGLRARAEHTGPATAGVYANTGVHIGDVTMAGTPVRSAYRQTVQRIAPLSLEGRDDELAELAAFCTTDQSGPYVWWRAPAWAGKSALMAWFALRPPAGVRIVPFFVTARFAAQSDRVAFADVVIEQLAELAGEPLPAYLTEATRESHLLALVERAAEACQRNGERLVLLVDGLDEDSGVTVGPDAHSIAALLPTRPPAGMRVIVAGRPNPPVPSDVTAHHPLREPGIVRTLAPSPYAKAVRVDAERELKRLLAGTPAEQDLLGLLTAAVGGLASADIAELTGLGEWQVEGHLDAVSGRTFARRAGRWHPERHVYVLAHEELQQQATRFLGESRLEAYRQRLHTWADGYRDNGWPTGTPEYLLRGYFRLLQTTGDLPRMTACATDRRRHDRMLDLSGGDAAAMTEVTATIDAFLARPDVDLAVMGRLAVHRDSLIGRNANLPLSLPEVWAKLGQVNRAEALARSLTEPYERALALVDIVGILLDGGALERAIQLAKEAEAALSAIDDPSQQTWARKKAAEALATTGDADRAQALARTIADPVAQAEALGGVAGALATAGHLDRAEAVALAIIDPGHRNSALGAVAAAWSTAGDIDRATALAHAITDSILQAVTLEDIALTGASATELAERAEAIPADTIEPLQDMTLTKLARALATAGDPHRAVTLAGAISSPTLQGRALADIGQAMGAAGDPRGAEGVISTIPDSRERVWAIAELAAVLATGGDFDAAEAMACTLADVNQQALALVDVGRAMADAGALTRAARTAQRAEALAREITEPHVQAAALAALARALSRVGERQRAAPLAERAEALAHTIGPSHPRTRVLIEAVLAVAESSDTETALHSAERAEALVRDNALWARHGSDLAELAPAFAIAGAHDRAQAIVRSIPNDFNQVSALANIARAHARAGEPAHAVVAAEQAEAIAETIIFADVHPGAWVDVATAYAGAGALAHAVRAAEQAETLAHDIGDPDERASTLADIASAYADAGALEQAIRAAEAAEALTRASMESARRSGVLATVAGVVAAAGDHPRAEALARSIAHPRLQAWAYTKIARRLATQGHMVAARSQLARALQLTRWTECLPSMPVVDPAAVSAIADEYAALMP